MRIPMLGAKIFVILDGWFVLPRVARLMMHTPAAITIFGCLTMVQLMAVFISMWCTRSGHFRPVALTLMLVSRTAAAAVPKALVDRDARQGTAATSALGN